MMRALILVVSAEEKDISSTTGMQATVATSELFTTRAKEVVPKRMREMEKAILEKNFETFGKLAMRDSNGFHATCLDTDPPIFYMNDVSRAAIRAVETINKGLRRVVAAYTFDAGPNAVIYYLEENTKHVIGTFKAILREKEGWTNDVRDLEAVGKDFSTDEKTAATLRRGVNGVIMTCVGEGPERVEDHLIDEKGDAI